MTEMSLHRIYFIFKGKDYSFQHWPQVPSKGDRILFYPKGEPTPFIVKTVCWNVIPNPEMNEFAVNVEIIRAKEPV